MGYGNVNCTPSLPLSPVLHVPNLPVDLLSVSSITNSRNCKASFDPHSCTFQDLKTRRNLGTGIEHDGLYYLTNASSPSPYALSMMDSLTSDEFLPMHYRLGHLSFQALGRMFPSQVKNYCKEKLLCDVCELAKHTRTNYPSSNERSKIPFDVVHSDVWRPSVVTTLTGDRYYVTFIDGFSRFTWLYLLKHKSEVLSAFKDFFNMVHNQFGMNVKILCSDNGTEYINGKFSNFLSSYGIIHQTTCVNTAEQNGWQRERIDIYWKLLELSCL